MATDQTQTKEEIIANVRQLVLRTFGEGELGDAIWTELEANQTIKAVSTGEAKLPSVHDAKAWLARQKTARQAIPQENY